MRLKLAALAIVSAMLAVPDFAVFAQTQPAPTARPARPADEDALQKAAVVKDPVERTEALIKVVNDFPRAVYIRNTVFYLMRPFRETSVEPEQLRSLLNRFVEGTINAPVYARSEFYYGLARELLSLDLLPDLSADLAAKGVAVLDEDAYIDNERRSHEQKEKYFSSRDPQRRPEPFSPAEAREKFRTFRASTYSALGRANLKLGKNAEAERALKQAYEIKPIMEAAVGLADIYEKQGKDKEAFDYLAAGLLSGRMTAEDIARTHALYRKMHGGKIEGFEQLLDARFRSSFRSPLKVEHYKPNASRAAANNPRVVLAEFVTGAGCEPCTAVDISFDAVLERYSRRDVIMIAYHMHAPTSDPMSNHSAQARHKYYGAVGAPTIYLDGKNFKPGEGLGTESERVYRNLDAALLERLDRPADAALRLQAKLDGSVLNVEAKGESINRSDSELRLHLALVEDEVSYSGENGLRFHPMVVRNLARHDGAEDYGFAFSGSQPASIAYAFDLERITAENLKYYDDYIADMKARLGDRFKVSFKEKRYLINRDRLSVVAFVQDEKTKDILQAVYLKVETGATGRK